jgi:methionine-rich copper-binding protein CopC
MVLGPAVARAHAMLESAMPPVGSRVTSAPAALTLSFSEALEARFSTVRVTTASGSVVNGGPIRTDPADPRQLIVPLQKLDADTYTVTWRAVSVDDHKTRGSYHFSVAP